MFNSRQSPSHGCFESPRTLFLSCGGAAIILVAAAFGHDSTHLAATTSFAEFAKKAESGNELSVVFLGGSLTAGTNASDPQLTSYRALIARRLRKQYPKARFNFWDAGMSGSGSLLGAFRLQRDVLRRKPDLVFVDFSSADDLTTTSPATLASYETIVRRIVSEAKAPVVVVLLPFRRHTENGKLASLKRRTAHLKIAAAYNAAVGDAVALTLARLQAGKTKPATIWPFDRVHPGDEGYALFAEAVWGGFQQAVKKKYKCSAPKKMLHAGTFLNTVRFPLTRLGNPVAGWRRDKPSRTSASYGMLMSRWLDDVLVAENQRIVIDTKGKKSVIKQAPVNLKISFRGETVILLGESTRNSGKYRVYIDGKLLESTGKEKKTGNYDAGLLAYLLQGNAPLIHVVAANLDAKKTHTLEIRPVFSAKNVQQELRLESVCVAGNDAKILASSK